ncbi:hypothetical protein PhaeoP10_00872 [Phaeobacter inhibens]|nr:hypothetical protein PhaeoP10_00872 [Phaeobacter inhibens]
MLTSLSSVSSTRNGATGGTEQGSRTDPFLITGQLGRWLSGIPNGAVRGSLPRFMFLDQMAARPVLPVFAPVVCRVVPVCGNWRPVTLSRVWWSLSAPLTARAALSLSGCEVCQRDLIASGMFGRIERAVGIGDQGADGAVVILRREIGAVALIHS